MDTDSDSQGPAFQAIRPKCPFYPFTSVFPAEGKVAIVQSYQRLFGSTICSPTLPARTESGYRISFNRSHRKRGPPALVS
jgi:hypothetical protein